MKHLLKAFRFRATSALGSEAESSRSAPIHFKVINDATVKGANLEKVLKLTGLTKKNYLISLIKMQQASFRNS
jgi:hypothetical protein